MRDCSRYFIALEDNVAATGMRMYGNPQTGDKAITSGESGAITLGALNEIVKNNGNVGLNEDSVVLLFSTEGDTNPERYRRIVWEGAFSV
ncbi:diaminopropionate ammonia-lyase [Vibrio harveyi]|nr:diaminopropionate ammonia-lyase [Vibrio harveyi]